MVKILNILIKYGTNNFSYVCQENANEVDDFQKNINYLHQSWPSHENRATELAR